MADANGAVAAAAASAPAGQPPSETPVTSEPRQHPYRESVQKGLYYPVVTFGDLKAKHRIAYFWSSQSPESWTSFRRIIEPFTRKPKNYSVILVQLFAPPRPDSLTTADPGAMLLCSNQRRDYATLAYNFLVYAKHPAALRSTGTVHGTAFVSDGNVDLAYQKTNLKQPEPNCAKNLLFQGRYILFISNSESFLADKLFGSAPAVAVDGVVVKDLSINEIQRRLR